MDEQEAVRLLVLGVIEYARSRAKDVARGAETPRLAALLVQKYGWGIGEAVAVIYDSPRAADPIIRAMDEETARIDSNWAKHGRERWAGRPADIIIHPATDSPT